MIIVHVPRPTKRSDGINIPPESIRTKNAQEILTPNEYQRLAMRTANPECRNLSNVGLGLAGEAGEVADEIKKHLHHGHPLNREKLIKECGDVFWYLALAATVLGVTVEDIMRLNIEKLKARYPDGFDSGRSLCREEGDV